MIIMAWCFIYLNLQKIDDSFFFDDPTSLSTPAMEDSRITAVAANSLEMMGFFVPLCETRQWRVRKKTAYIIPLIVPEESSRGTRQRKCFLRGVCTIKVV